MGADLGGAVTLLTEERAEQHVAASALTAAYPGLVGLAVDLPLCAAGAARRTRLRHGFLSVRPERVAVSGPPSPGLEVALARMAEDLEAAAVAVPAQTTGPGVRVSLEAGTEDDSPTGLRRRWAVAHAIAPVLTAAFANRPGPGGARTTRRSPVPAGSEPDPRRQWARQVLDAPVTAAGITAGTFRQWIREGPDDPPILADLDRHRRAFRPPVAARGHLEISVADRQPGHGWAVPAAVVTTLIEDPLAAAEALVATAGLAGAPRLWERAAGDALADPELAAAARSLFLSAYAALARRGAPRPVRDAVGGYLERYVLRGRCPADDLIERRGPVKLTEN